MSAMKPTVAFAPGVWHTADCFDVVQNTLHTRGWPTAAVEYPSIGDERLTKRLADDADAVRATVNLCDTDANISQVINITKMPLRKQTEICILLPLHAAHVNSPFRRLSRYDYRTLMDRLFRSLVRSDDLQQTEKEIKRPKKRASVSTKMSADRNARRSLAKKA
ncbi:hypothetical protein NM208_g287 [Fusarium decemcellulare]|uniref:Uncharacterized protein n=1 Tax=Fusarium decemcellulare TaxID=57161 RepID=A0ACC1T0B4_9HYPO|nr:hypothetical protein NM208_g287 [Fusarium decemcellulare]